MASGDIGLVQEILSFRILIEKVMGALNAAMPPQNVQVEQLARRFDDARVARRVVKGGVRSVGSQRSPGGRRAARDVASTDPETVTLLKKLAVGDNAPGEIERLVALLEVADRDLTRSRMKVAIGRYL